MNKYVAAALVIALLSLSGASLWTAHRISVMTRKGEELSATTQQAMTHGAEFFEFQLDEFRSDAYQRRIKQGFEVGRDASITIAKFNRIVIPEIAGLIRDARANNLPSLNRLTLSFDDLVRNTDASINKTLIPRIVAIAEALQDSVEDVAEVINSLNLTVGELTNLAKNPDIALIIKEFKAASANFNLITGHFNEASASFAEGLTKFPSLMTSFDKYAKASTTWQKRLYLAMIIRQLAAIPLRLP